MAREIVLVLNVQHNMENLYRFLLRSPALQLCQRSCRSGEAERAIEMFRYQCICMSCDQNIMSQFYLLILTLLFKPALSVKHVHAVVSSCVHKGVT